jgi:hypothetical protein
MSNNTPINIIKSQLPHLSSDELSNLKQEVILLLAGIVSTEPQSMLEIVTVDVPIQGSKNEETGVLHIQFPFHIGLRNNLGWRAMKVTMAAQQALLHIFSQSLAADDLAGRTPPKPATRQ